MSEHSNCFHLLHLPQNAVQDNQTSKRRRKTMTNLLRKEEQPQDALAMLAPEAAAAAASRSSRKGRTGTKALKDETEDDEDPRRNSRGGVVQDIEAEAHDIREKGIHHLNLQARLPWLKAPPKDGSQEQQDDDQTQDIVSPDSSEDPLSPDLVASLHDLISEDPKSIASSVHSLLVNGYLNGGSPQLPPKDYDQTTPPASYHGDNDRVPPRDYPTKSEGGSHTNLLDDNDYYSMMLNDAH